MFTVQRASKRLVPQVTRIAQMSTGGEWGSGAGKGGGGGGSIREAGGSFGRMEAAHEEEYFHRKQVEALRLLKEEKIHQADFHKSQIKEHEEAIRRHKEFLKNVTK